MKELYFVRHGQTEWNAIRRMQGQWNSDLNELGRQQAEVNGKFLGQLGIDALIASPLDRTQQTAKIITSHLAISYSVDDRLKEWIGAVKCGTSSPINGPMNLLPGRLINSITGGQTLKTIPI